MFHNLFKNYKLLSKKKGSSSGSSSPVVLPFPRMFEAGQFDELEKNILN